MSKADDEVKVKAHDYLLQFLKMASGASPTGNDGFACVVAGVALNLYFEQRFAKASFKPGEADRMQKAARRLAKELLADLEKSGALN